MMKNPLRLAILSITSMLFIITLIFLPFFGINPFITFISDLGFFEKVPILHDSLTFIIFFGSAFFIFLWTIRKTKERKGISSLGYLYLLSLTSFSIFQMPILEWICLWLLCIWAIYELIKGWR